MANHYETLEVAQTATKKEIKKAYYRLAKKYHPDHNQGDAAAAERFKAVGEAYRVLSDDTARAEYDRALAAGPAEPKGAGKRGAPQAQQPRSGAPRAAAPSGGHVDFQRMADSFAAFYGFDPKTKRVTNEDKLNTYAREKRQRNPLDTTAMFEQFLGIKK